MSFFFGRLLALQDLASIYFGFCSQFKLHCPTSILEIRAKYDRISLAHPLASQQIMYIEQRTEDHCTFCLLCVSHPSQVVWTSKPLPDHHWKTSCCSFSFLFFVSLTWWGYAEPLSVSICLVTRDSKPAQKLWAMDSLLSELQWPKASVPAVLLFKANSTSALDWISCRVCMVDAASSKEIPPLFNASYPDSPTSKFIQMYFTQTSKNQSHHHVHSETTASVCLHIGLCSLLLSFERRHCQRAGRPSWLSDSDRWCFQPSIQTEQGLQIKHGKEGEVVKIKTDHLGSFILISFLFPCSPYLAGLIISGLQP